MEGGRETFTRFTPALTLEVGCEEDDDRKRIAKLLRCWGYEIVGIVLARGIVEVSWEQHENLDNPFIKKYPSNVLFLSNK